MPREPGGTAVPPEPVTCGTQRERGRTSRRSRLACARWRCKLRLNACAAHYGLHAVHCELRLATAGGSLRERVRGWKLFLLAPRMLHRAPGSGRAPPAELDRRSQLLPY